MTQDTRWKQRLENFDKALKKLYEFAGQAEECKADIYQVALIGAFKFTFELGWKTLKDYLNYSGVDVSTPRDVIKQAFHHGLIENGETWMSMLGDRNIMSHVYDEKRAAEAVRDIQNNYIEAIEQVCNLMKTKEDE